jgi:hypothetical protein
VRAIPNQSSNLYAIEFENVTIIQRVLFVDKQRVKLIKMEKVEYKKRSREIPWYEPLIHLMTNFFNRLMRLCALT